jgi:hypothetical protein
VLIRVTIKLELAEGSVLSIMSATSGIAVSPELASTFAHAVSSRNVRFLKISVQNGLCYGQLSINFNPVLYLLS